MRFAIPLTIALLAAGCSAVPESPVDIEDSGIDIAGIIIRNQLAYTVTDVMVEAPVSGAFAGCGNILPRSQCSTSIPAADYRRNPIVISWKEYGQPHRTDEFIVKVPDGMLPGAEAWLKVLVFAPGQAGATLVNDPEP